MGTVFELNPQKNTHHGTATSYNYRNSAHTGPHNPDHQNSHLDGQGKKDTLVFTTIA